MMSRKDSFLPDRLHILIEGKRAERFLTMCAHEGVRLSRVRRDPQGQITAAAAGRDLLRLAALAERGGWQLTVRRRRGPGRRVERLWRRPGLVCGAAVFFLLIRLFCGYLWAIDFGTLEAAQQREIRSRLHGAGIVEGCRMDKETLKAGQQALIKRAQEFGWLSLNFVGGCLFVEQTPREKAEIRPETESTALYAAADALVLEENIRSGFCKVYAGQTVAAGQLLAGATRFARDGTAVSQAASGTVLGRVNKRYSAEAPRICEVTVPGGVCAEKIEVTLLGRVYPFTQGTVEGSALRQCAARIWPLKLGKIALPASLRITQSRAAVPLRLQYSEDTAKALAVRACHRQLLQEFPDAAIETAEAVWSCEKNRVQCSWRVIFCADIARTGPAPAETPPPQDP